MSFILLLSVSSLILYLLNVALRPKPCNHHKPRSQAVNFYSSDAWRKLRYRTIQARGRRCEACRTDSTDIRYHVDHIKPRSLYPNLALEDSNVQVLCQLCNMGKGDQDQTDWRV